MVNTLPVLISVHTLRDIQTQLKSAVHVALSSLLLPLFIDITLLSIIYISPLCTMHGSWHGSTRLLAALLACTAQPYSCTHT